MAIATRKGNFMQPAKVFNFRRGLVNGTIYVFFRREPNGPWYTVREKRIEVFQNGRSLGLKWDLRGAKLVVGPAAFGLNHPPDLGWAIIFRRLARDLLPADPEKFLAAVLERGEITGPLTEYGKQYAIELLKSVLWGMLIGMGTKAAGQWLDRLADRLFHGTDRTKAHQAKPKSLERRSGTKSRTEPDESDTHKSGGPGESATSLEPPKPRGTPRAKKTTGNLFNRLRKRNYPYNEVYVDKPAGKGYYRLDSYDPKNGEIISRKATQLWAIREESAIAYILEIPRKYHSGASISKVPTNGTLAGKQLEGQMILEIPIQQQPIPKRVLDAARQADVIIRDVNGRIYNP